MQTSSKQLRSKIRRFSRVKLFVAPLLIVAGIFGLVLPIIPGVIFLFSGRALIVPSIDDKIKGKTEKK